MGQLFSFIRMAIRWDRKAEILTFSQFHYIKTLLSRFDIKDIYRRVIPIDPHTDLTKFDREATIDKKKIYSSVVGDID